MALFLSLNAQADKFSYSPQKVAAKGIERVKISGVKGRLLIKEKATKFYRIRVSHSKDKKFEDWSLSADRVHDALVLEVFNVAYGAQWNKMVKQDKWPEFDIEIEGPAVPAVVGWREGAIEISGWGRGVELSFLNGSVQSLNTRGNLKLEAVNADVKVRNHIGNLELRGENGRVELLGFNGQAKISWLAGTFKGDGLKGEQQIDWPNGHVTLSNVFGKVKGKSDSAEWNVKAKAPAELDVAVNSGTVKVVWQGGGLKYFLSGAKGKLKSALPCAASGGLGEQICEGQRKGREKPVGEVFARSKTGLVMLQIP